MMQGENETFHVPVKMSTMRTVLTALCTDFLYASLHMRDLTQSSLFHSHSSDK